MINKNIIFISIFLLLFAVVNVNAGTYNATCDYNSTWDISTLSVNDTLDVSGVIPANSLRGECWNEDGTIFYQMEGGYGVNQYNLSTGWDFDTATYHGGVSLTGDEIYSTGCEVRGNYFFMVGTNEDTIFKYTFTNQDINTLSSSQSLDISAQEGTPLDIEFNSDGTKMYVIGKGSDEINQWNLSSAYDLSTATFHDNVIVQSTDSNPQQFNIRGNKAYMLGSENQKVFEYNITDDDINNLVLDDEYSIGYAVQGSYVNNYGTKVFIGNSGTRVITEYDMDWGVNCSGGVPVCSVTINTPTASNYTTQDISVNISSSNCASVKFDWNGTNVTYTTPTTVTFPVGEHTLNAYGDDVLKDTVTFRVYDTPTDITFTSNPQLVMNNTNATFTWTHGTSYWPLINYTIYVCKPNLIFECPVINSYSVTNTTTIFNYSNGTTDDYRIFIETCNDYLCSNSSFSDPACFEYVSFVDTPTLVTSLETYDISIYATTSCGDVDNVIIFKDVSNSTAIFSTPNYETSYDTTLYENDTYTFTSNITYNYYSTDFILQPVSFNLTIYNFSIATCSDASGFINYTLVDESEGLMTGDIGTFIRVHQPLGDINATLNMSSDNHLQFCITPKKNYTLSSDIYYIADAIGRTEEYYLNDAVYDTTQDNILYLYNLNNSDILNVIVLDEYSSKKIGSVVNLIKFYPATMSSKTIASAKTNSEGEVNFFYDRNDQIKLTVVEDGITEYQDSEFNKYYSITGYYSRTVKLGSGIIPTIDNIVFDCFTSVDNSTYNKVECEFESTDGQQHNFSLWVYDTGFNYTDILNGSYSNTTSYQLEFVYTSSGSLEISSDVMSGLYEFKIDGITRKSGVLNYNASAVPVELKYLTLPFVFLVLILGAINPFFALGGFFILGLFSDPTTSTFMFFDNNFILGSVVAIIIAFVIEEVKAVTKKR